MCHQSIEKIFKGYYTSINNNPPPYTHSLAYLAEKCGLIDEVNEKFIEHINMIEPMNIEARYPSYKEKLLKGLTEEKCQELISKTKELQSWVKMKL